MVRELQRRSIFFKFVNKYVTDHKVTAFTGVTNDSMNAFRAYLEQSKFDYQEDSETKVEGLCKRRRRTTTARMCWATSITCSLH